MMDGKSSFISEILDIPKNHDNNILGKSNPSDVSQPEKIKEKIKLIITKKNAEPDKVEVSLPSQNKDKIKLNIIKKTEADFKTDVKEETKSGDSKKSKESQRYFCYILKNKIQSEIKKTYNGFTVDLKRRIRQHNSEIKGGAKYTTSNGQKTWHYYAVLTGFDSYESALSCEWWIKHPTGGKRPMKFSGPRGRILGLHKVAEETRFKGYNKALEYTLWIDRTYLNCLDPKLIKPNIKIMTFTSLDDITNYYDTLDKQQVKANPTLQDLLLTK